MLGQHDIGALDVRNDAVVEVGIDATATDRTCKIDFLFHSLYFFAKITTFFSPINVVPKTKFLSLSLRFNVFRKSLALNGKFRVATDASVMSFNNSFLIFLLKGAKPTTSKIRPGKSEMRLSEVYK